MGDWEFKALRLTLDVRRLTFDASLLTFDHGGVKIPTPPLNA